MENSPYINDLVKFLQRSPTPFHAVTAMTEMLQSHGFEELREQDNWSLTKSSKYFVVHNNSALIAFKTGESDSVQNGFRIAGAHTDSPCLKVKPNPEIQYQGYTQLGVEVYGGALLHPWFDRDLSLAGRVHYLNSRRELSSALIDFEFPLAVIPSLAIHLNREANAGYKLNPQKEMSPLLLQQDEEFNFDDFLKHKLEEKFPGDVDKILSHEMYFYDSQPAAVIGPKSQFLASARLDNLLSCFIACRSLIESNDKHCSVLVCNDHEEVGSTSSSGAQGPFLKASLQRMLTSLGQKSDDWERAISQSLMLSIDNAHGIHPNYKEKHDDKHQPLLNSGPVIKLNANQRYASNSQSVAQFKSICEQANVPYQAFVMRSDMACGSTIGPITSAELGVPTVDVGLATFAMHSIRELAGTKDPELLANAVTAFFNR